MKYLHTVLLLVYIILACITYHSTHSFTFSSLGYVFLCTPSGLKQQGIFLTVGYLLFITLDLWLKIVNSYYLSLAGKKLSNQSIVTLTHLLKLLLEDKQPTGSLFYFQMVNRLLMTYTDLTSFHIGSDYFD